jgi:hypothetical protein
MKTTEHILHIAKLKNNCPECYTSNSMEISFKQQQIENRFYSKNQKDIIEIIYCQNCKNVIYPVNWNDDIEKIYDYHKKQAEPRKLGIRLKPQAIVILIAFAIAVLLVFSLMLLN